MNKTVSDYLQESFTLTTEAVKKDKELKNKIFGVIKENLIDKGASLYKVLDLVYKIKSRQLSEKDFEDYKLDFANYLEEDLIHHVGDLFVDAKNLATEFFKGFYYTDNLIDGYFLDEFYKALWDKKYRLKTIDGKPIDRDVFDTFARVALATSIGGFLSHLLNAKSMARLADSVSGASDRIVNLEDIKKAVEKEFENYYPELSEQLAKFYSVMSLGLFTGAGRIMANAGAAKYKKSTTLINCTVMKQIPDSMEGIMDVLKDASLTLKAGAGVGYAFSTIRPKGAPVQGAGAHTSGVISFMEIYDQTCATIESAGGRRGAQMATLHVAHPEIEDYITYKRNNPGKLLHFNLSVFATDDFMQKVKLGIEAEKEKDEKKKKELLEKAKWDLWFWEKTDELINLNKIPDDVVVVEPDKTPFDYPEFDKFVFAPNHVEVLYKNTEPNRVFKKKIYKTVYAHDLYKKIMESTLDMGEPGILFYDTLNKYNPLTKDEQLIATNPCFVGSTRISTANGLIPIEELAKNGGSFDIVVDKRAPVGGEGKPYGDIGTTIKTALKAFPTGKKPIRRLVTKEGYELTLTPDHKLLTPEGYKEVQELKPGDKILIQSGEGRFGNLTELKHDIEGMPTKLDEKLSELLGLMTADGLISERSKAVRLIIDKEKLSDFERIVNYIDQTFGSKVQPHRNNKNVYQIFFRREETVLKFFRDAIGLVGYSHERRVPEIFFRTTKENVAAFIRGLFAGDGSVQMYNDRCRASLRLSSSNLDLLKDVQLLLLNFGIYSRIRKVHDEKTHLMPDGKGGKKEYISRPNYELMIGADNIRKFVEKIGLIRKKHKEKYENYKCGLKQFKKFYARVEEIIDEGYADVYDLTEMHTHSLVANGIVSHNCGEQPLNASGSCLLGSLYVDKFVENSYEQNATFNFDALRTTTQIINQLMDHVNTISNLPLPGLKYQAFIKRRHGLGFTGLADAMARLGIVYGNNEEAKDFVKRVLIVMLGESLIVTNKYMAEKYGPAYFFTDSVAKNWKESPFFEKAFNATNDINDAHFKNLIEMYKQELNTLDKPRYSHALSIAPTGTISMAFGNNVVNGIEPAYYTVQIRNVITEGKATKKAEVLRYAFVEAYNNKFGEKLEHKKPRPEWLKLAVENVSVDDHLTIQAVAQLFVDSAISKTINLPPEFDANEIMDTYLKGWKLGLKGMTTFRSNPSFSVGVLSTFEYLEDMEIEFVDENGNVVKVKGHDIVEYDGDKHLAANLFEALYTGKYGNYSLK